MHLSAVHVFRVDTTSVAGLLRFMKQRGLEAHLCLLCNTFSFLIVRALPYSLLTGKPVEIGEICGNTDFTDYSLTLCIVTLR